MDLVFEHVQADRGFILLRDEKTGELIPTVVRTRDDDEASPKRQAQAQAQAAGNGPLPVSVDDANGSGPPPPPRIHASRTIINHVIQNAEGVLSSNAMADQRFSKGKSVHNLGIRSALCVPIKARKLSPPPPRPSALNESKTSNDDILGVIYVDSSVRNFTYSTDQLRLLNAIGM